MAALFINETIIKNNKSGKTGVYEGSKQRADGKELYAITFDTISGPRKAWVLAENCTVIEPEEKPEPKIETPENNSPWCPHNAADLEHVKSDIEHSTVICRCSLCGQEFDIMNFAEHNSLLNSLTSMFTSFPTFVELTDADYTPTVLEHSPHQKILADCYDAAQTALANHRRAYRGGTGKKGELVNFPISKAEIEDDEEFEVTKKASGWYCAPAPELAEHVQIINDDGRYLSFRDMTNDLVRKHTPYPGYYEFFTSDSPVLNMDDKEQAFLAEVYDSMNKNIGRHGKAVRVSGDVYTDDKEQSLRRLFASACEKVSESGKNKYLRIHKIREHMNVGHDEFDRFLELLAAEQVIELTYGNPGILTKEELDNSYYPPRNDYSLITSIPFLYIMVHGEICPNRDKAA